MWILFDRDYDQAGYEYWLSNLNNGVETKYELLLGFAESAEKKDFLLRWLVYYKKLKPIFSIKTT